MCSSGGNAEQCAAYLCGSALKWLDKVLQTDVMDDVIAIAIGGGTLMIWLYLYDAYSMQHSLDYVISGYPSRICQIRF